MLKHVILAIMSVSIGLSCLIPQSVAAFPGPYFHSENANLAAGKQAVTVALLKEFSLTTTVGSNELGISCRNVTSTNATIFNTSLDGQGEAEKLTFKMCTVEKQIGCKIPNEEIKTSEIYSSLEYETEPTQEEVDKKTFSAKMLYYFAPKESPKGTFATVTLESCSTGGINGSYNIKGNFAGKLTSSERQEAAKDGVAISESIDKMFDTVEETQCGKEVLTFKEFAVSGLTFGGAALKKLSGEFGIEFGAKELGEWDELL